MAIDQANLAASLAFLQTPARCAWKCTAHGFLHQFLLQRGIAPLAFITAPHAEAFPANFHSEEAVLAQFFVDLSLVDCTMNQHLPSTVAISALFLSRLTLDQLSRTPLTLTHSQGLIHTSSREALALHEGSRHFVARDPSFTSEPFGHPSLGSYIRSCPREADSFLECVNGLHVQVENYRDHALLGHADPLDFYINLAMKYGGPDSNRGKAWKVGFSLPGATVARALADAA